MAPYTSYEWSPQQVDTFAKLFRSVLPIGHLGIEHTPGHIPLGEGDTDWVTGGIMTQFDVLMTEFDSPLQHNENIWQIASRTLGSVSLGGTYKRPPDQPANDDPSPPWYLRAGTPRGPYSVCAFEFNTYEDCRGRLAPGQNDADRAYLKLVGYTNIC